MPPFLSVPIPQMTMGGLLFGQDDGTWGPENRDNDPDTGKNGGGKSPAALPRSNARQKTILEAFEDLSAEEQDGILKVLDRLIGRKR